MIWNSSNAYVLRVKKDDDILIQKELGFQARASFQAAGGTKMLNTIYHGGKLAIMRFVLIKLKITQVLKQSYSKASTIQCRYRTHLMYLLFVVHVFRTPMQSDKEKKHGTKAMAIVS